LLSQLPRMSSYSHIYVPLMHAILNHTELEAGSYWLNAAFTIQHSFFLNVECCLRECRSLVRPAPHMDVWSASSEKSLRTTQDFVRCGS
jgi:hypothetical protein